MSTVDIKTSINSNIGVADAKKMSCIVRTMSGYVTPFDIDALLQVFGIELKTVSSPHVKYNHSQAPVFYIPAELNKNHRRFILTQLLGVYLFSAMKPRNAPLFERECSPNKPSIKTQNVLADVFAMESLLPENEVKKMASTMSLDDACKYFDVAPAIFRARLQMLQIKPAR